MGRSGNLGSHREKGGTPGRQFCLASIQFPFSHRDQMDAGSQELGKKTVFFELIGICTEGLRRGTRGTRVTPELGEPAGFVSGA